MPTKREPKTDDAAGGQPGRTKKPSSLRISLFCDPDVFKNIDINHSETNSTLTL